MRRIEEAVEALNKEAYTERDIALAGACVTLGYDGAVRIERGYVRPEDEPKAKGKAKDAEAEKAGGPAPLPEKLVAELTAYRTSALRNELARHPGIALAALVHTLALDLFFTDCVSCLEIRPKRTWLTNHAPGIDESAAERESAERHETWRVRLPESPEALWDYVRGLADDELMSLLAHCVSLTANAVQLRSQWPKASAHAGVLAREVNLDMTRYWQPSAANYLARVSKERIPEAVREGVSEQAAQSIAAMKKQAMAEAAEKALADKGWLPALLRQAA